MKSLFPQLALVGLLAAVLAVVSCQRAPGPAFSGLAPIAAGHADVYLYRAHALAAFGDAFTVRVDGHRVGALYDASYLRLSLTAGRHHLEVAPGGMARPVSVDLAVDAGGRAFYEFRFATGWRMRPSFPGAELVALDESAALTALSALRSATGAATDASRPLPSTYEANPALVP